MDSGFLATYIPYAHMLLIIIIIITIIIIIIDITVFLVFLINISATKLLVLVLRKDPLATHLLRGPIARRLR